MKNTLNIAAFMLIIIGLIFKVQHWPGANIAVMLSAASMLLALFMFAVKDNKEAGVTDGLNYFLVGALSLFILGTLFKFYHWPGARILGLAAYGMALLVPLALLLQKDAFKISKQFFITFMTFFILLISIMPHSPISQYFRKDNHNTGPEVSAEMTSNNTSNIDEKAEK